MVLTSTFFVPKTKLTSLLLKCKHSKSCTAWTDCGRRSPCSGSGRERSFGDTSVTFGNKKTLFLSSSSSHAKWLQKRDGFSGSDKAVFVARNKTLSSDLEGKKKGKSEQHLAGAGAADERARQASHGGRERAGRARPGFAHSYGRDSLCLWCRMSFTGSRLNTQISCKRPCARPPVRDEHRDLRGTRACPAEACKKTPPQVHSWSGFTVVLKSLQTPTAFKKYFKKKTRKMIGS